MGGPQLRRSTRSCVRASYAQRAASMSQVASLKRGGARSRKAMLVEDRMAEEDPKTKLRNALEEMDIAVRSREKLMRTLVDELVGKMRSSFSMQLMRLPKNIRCMSMATFREKHGGDVDSVLKESVDKMKNTTRKTLCANPPKTPGRKTPRSARTPRSKAESVKPRRAISAREPTTARGARRQTSAAARAFAVPTPSTGRTRRAPPAGFARPPKPAPTPTAPRRRSTRLSMRQQHAHESDSESDADSDTSTSRCRRSTRRGGALAMNPLLPKTPAASGRPQSIVARATLGAGREEDAHAGIVVELDGQELNLASPTAQAALGNGGAREEVMSQLTALHDQLEAIMSNIF